MLEQLEKSAVAPEDPQTMSENVFRRIQAAIVKGEVAPRQQDFRAGAGAHLRDSRGPLREAIHRLEGQRLLVRVPRARGVFEQRRAGRTL